MSLRAAQPDDLGMLRQDSVADDPFQFFGFSAANALERGFAVDGLISEDHGLLVVEDEGGSVAGSVSWSAVRHGPTSTARAFNVGIALLPGHRGMGLGSAALVAFAEYLFANTLIERLEAGTDVDNLAAQGALERAGFQREGVQRHAQFRDGGWHDLVTYGRLRGDRLS